MCGQKGGAQTTPESSESTSARGLCFQQKWRIHNYFKFQIKKQTVNKQTIFTLLHRAVHAFRQNYEKSQPTQYKSIELCPGKRFFTINCMLVSHNNSPHFGRCCLPMKLRSGDRLAVTRNSSPEHMMLCCHYLNVRLPILLANRFGHFPSMEAKANPCIWQAATLWEARDVLVGEDTLGGPRRNVREADWAEKEEMVPDVQGWPSRQVSWSRGVVVKGTHIWNQWCAKWK